MKLSNTMDKKQNEKKVIIVMGSPGAGKGTQAGLLAERFDLYHWETSKVVGRAIEEAPKGDFVEIEGKKYYFEEERKLRESGKLWDPPFVVEISKEKLKELAKEGESVALAGSPRTLYEGEKIVPLLKELYGSQNITVLLIEISEKEALWRNTHRRECELVRHPILFLEETVKLTKCPLDGSKLVSRKDDTPEVIKVRLKEYRKRTLPLIDYFKKEGLKIKRIDGSPAPIDVFNAILKTLQ